ncbi:MAG: MFS transporter [Alphaproteobacteria bacterium]|nr:MFS transporter [Alphaproteobacteria bacterium]
MTAASCGIQFLLAALVLQSFGLYIATLSDEMGWSKTALSAAAALQSVEAAIIGPLLGWVVDRFGSPVMIRFGVVIMGLGLCGLSQIDSLAGFYACAIIMAIGTSFCGYFPLSVALVQWFERHRARALAIMSSGLALGGLAVPLVAWVMQTWGWRTAALSSGLAAILIGIPLSRVMVRRPQDLGLQMDGDEKPWVEAGMHDSTRHIQTTPAREFTARQALQTRAFWYLAAGHGMALVVVTAVNVHAISHMKEGLGYTVAQAGFIIMLMTLGQLVGVMLGAWLGDKFSKRKIAAVCMLSHALGLLMLTFAPSVAWLLAFSAFHGVAWGLRGPLMQAIRADYFGRNSIGMIMGLSAAIIAIGQVAGPMVAGILADLTGDYRWGFSVLAFVAALGSVAFWLAIKPELSRADP